MNTYKTSTGHNFSTSPWLDLHYDAARPEYESMVRNIGIKKGWHVLDAGCGNGRFIEPIDALVGPMGKITAIDLAPENITIVKKHIRARQFISNVSSQIGTITKLPYKDNSFDAVWCAAVTQYLTPQALETALQEFKRVLKPEGVLAIKEYDGISSYYYPTAEMTLLWKSVQEMDAFDKKRWFEHPIEMHSLLKKAGFSQVIQKTILIERRYPLDDTVREYIKELIRGGQIAWADILTLPKKEQKLWNKLLEETSPQYILNQPNFYWREGHILATGKKHKGE